jgi:hypothetical protein
VIDGPLERRKGREGRRGGRGKRGGNAPFEKKVDVERQEHPEFKDYTAVRSTMTGDLSRRQCLTTTRAIKMM